MKIMTLAMLFVINQSFLIAEMPPFNEQIKKEVLKDFAHESLQAALRQTSIDDLYESQKILLLDFCLDLDMEKKSTCNAIKRIIQETLIQQYPTLAVKLYPSYGQTRSIIDNAYERNDKDFFIALETNSMKHNYTIAAADEIEKLLKKNFESNRKEEIQITNEALSELLKKDTYTPDQRAYLQYLIDLKNK